MIARSPEAGSWQKTTCSWPVDRSKTSSPPSAEARGCGDCMDVVTVVTPGVLPRVAGEALR